MITKSSSTIFIMVKTRTINSSILLRVYYNVPNVSNFFMIIDTKVIQGVLSAILEKYSYFTQPTMFTLLIPN